MKSRQVFFVFHPCFIDSWLSPLRYDVYLIVTCRVGMRRKKTLISFYGSMNPSMDHATAEARVWSPPFTREDGQTEKVFNEVVHCIRKGMASHWQQSHIIRGDRCKRRQLICQGSRNATLKFFFGR